MFKLYHELAEEWYPLFTPVEDYAEEAGLYHEIFTSYHKSVCRTVLELGSGGGHNAWYMKRWYQLTLSDISEHMIATSRKINPECEHIQGDMKTLRLDREFDAVFIHDAVMYMTTEEALLQAIETAYIHCKAGGMLLVSPDCTKETFAESTEEGGSDRDGKSIRWLEWSYDPDPQDSQFTVDYACLLKDTSGRVTVEHDQHLEGLFPEATWKSIFNEAGFDVKPLPDSFGRINFLGFK